MVKKIHRELYSISSKELIKRLKELGCTEVMIGHGKGIRKFFQDPKKKKKFYALDNGSNEKMSVMAVRQVLSHAGISTKTFLEQTGGLTNPLFIFPKNPFQI